MSLASGVFTIEEVDAQIKNIKEQLLSANQSYSISPADGGASRSVTRNSRDRLNAELTVWLKRRRALAGAHRGGTRVKTASFGKSRSCRLEGFETK